MMVPIPIMTLTSLLVIAVADGVPKFGITRGCRIDSSSPFDVNAGLKKTIKRCVNDEQNGGPVAV
jgi:hypothetical protein